MKCYSLIARVSFCAFLLHSSFAVCASAVSAPIQDEQQRAQRQAMPTHTAKGALTMQGHVERLEQRLGREAAQRSRNTVGASTQAQQQYVQEKKESVIKRSDVPITPFVVTTANILGAFDDPFEFAGNYGEENNEIREKVFDLIVSKEALAKNLSKEALADLVAKSTITPTIFIADNIKEDKNHGPTMQEVVTPELFDQIKEKLLQLKVDQKDIDALARFVTKYGNEKIFYFMRNNPPDILKLEKALKDDAADKGKSFDLPVLGSKRILTGKNALELKKNLANAVFTQEVLNKANPTFVDKKDENKIKPITVNIDKLKPDFLRGFFKNGDNKDLYAFCTPAGLAFFYWLYQSLIFDLIAQDPSLIDDINTVKTEFAASLGDPKKRAAVFRQRLIVADSKLLFTQEADKYTRDSLMQDDLFLPIGKQNTKDGTLILLRSDFWEPDFEIIPFNEYAKYKAGKLTAILATQKASQQKFLLVSGHGHSEQAEDGREQMQHAVKKLAQLTEEKGEEIFLIIGTDANTKKKADVEAFQKVLNELGLISTHVGPTTIKRRMVTVQHGKSGLYAVDEEDYIIVKKDQLTLSNATIGFGKPGERADLSVSLPNMDNQSDHYAVSALVQSKEATSNQEKALQTVKTPTTELLEESAAEPKTRRSSLPKKGAPKKAKKIVTWADESGGQLKEEREPEKAASLETIAQKKSPSTGG